MSATGRNRGSARLHVVLVALAAATVVLLALFRHRLFTPVDPARAPAASSASSHAPRVAAPEPPKPIDLASAADLAQIGALVQRLRDAAIKSDKLTREAMIQGLVKHGPAARQAVQDAASRERDNRALDAFAEAIGRIP